MFREAVVIAVPVATAQARLAARLGDDCLQPQAAQSSAEAAQTLLRAGFGPVSKQVIVRALRAYQVGETIVFPIRWEASGPAGRLFPTLDANVQLSPAVDEKGTVATEVVFIGSYRPPLGTIGAVIDQALLHQTAMATVRSFLHRVAPVLARDPSVASKPWGCVVESPETESI